MYECYYCGWKQEWESTKSHLIEKDPDINARHLRLEWDHRRARSKGGRHASLAASDDAYTTRPETWGLWAS